MGGGRYGEGAQKFWDALTCKNGLPDNRDARGQVRPGGITGVRREVRLVKDAGVGETSSPKPIPTGSFPSARLLAGLKRRARVS